ncbi:MAG: NAD(+)/NADH kinase [Pseudomonadota bacterium]
MGRTAQVLLVTKRSFYQHFGLEKKVPRFLELMAQSGEHAARLLRDHDENLKVTEAVEAFLTGGGISYRLGAPPGVDQDGEYDLVITVGGDGTLLDASHWLVDTPIVGINSRPTFSVGWFCAATRHDFPDRLRPILAGEVAPRNLTRCSVSVGGVELPPPALNDFLYTAVNPATSTVYSIELDGRRELQKSSGIWVSTPAGSTAGILNAGGTRMPLGACMLQFAVREVFRRQDTLRLLRETFTGGLRITNLTPEAAVWVDGGHIRHDLGYGDVIEPRRSTRPLRIHL